MCHPSPFFPSVVGSESLDNCFFFNALYQKRNIIAFQIEQVVVFFRTIKLLHIALMHCKQTLLLIRIEENTLLGLLPGSIS
jgi:Na+-transporting methylmalonyl-CoA/oxaloacetate decarboxylase beta subunit